MDPQNFTAVDALVSIWRRKAIVMVFFLGTIVAVGLFTILCEKTYKSDAKILVRLGRENSALDATAGLGGNQPYSLPVNRNSEINSIVEMIQNKDLFEKVVTNIGPEKILKKTASTDGIASNSDDAPGLVDRLMEFLKDIGVRNDLPLRERAMIKLQKKIDVKTNENSNVVSIGFESYDPKVAQEIVGAIVNEYCKQHARAHRSQHDTEFLAKQTASAREELFENEKAFEEFKTSQGMISVEGQRKAMVERIAKLKNDLMATEAETRAVESEISERKQSAALMEKTQPLAQTSGAGNDGIDAMQAELFRLELEYESALSKYSLENPVVSQLEDQYKAAVKAFGSAKSKMLELVEGPNKLYVQAMIEIMLKEPRLVWLNSKTTALKEQLVRVENELDKFNANETKFIRLQRDVEISDKNFQRHSTILAQAEMDSRMQENDMSNLSIFQAAALNLKPFRPNKLINLLVGLFAGIVGGCSLAVLLGFREAFRFHGGSMSVISGPSNDEFESVLDLPVIATIPRQQRRLYSHSNN